MHDDSGCRTRGCEGSPRLRTPAPRSRPFSRDARGVGGYVIPIHTSLQSSHQSFHRRGWAQFLVCTEQKGLTEIPTRFCFHMHVRRHRRRGAFRVRSEVDGICLAVGTDVTQQSVGCRRFCEFAHNEPKWVKSSIHCVQYFASNKLVSSSPLRRSN